MRLLKLKHGSRVSGRSSSVVRPSVDSGAVFANHQTFRNSLGILGNSVGCVLIVVGLGPCSSYADPLIFTITMRKSKNYTGIRRSPS